MTNAQAIDALAVRVCQVAREVREDHEAWVGIDCLEEFLGIEDLRLVDAALAFASAKGWLSLSGSPAHSILLNGAAP
jgi:hypothetical protein